MKLLLAAACFLVASASAQTFKDVSYYHQESPEKKAKEVDGSIVSSPGVFKFESKKVNLEIPHASITKIVYERASKPRYAAGLLFAWPLLFTKSKQHYLTVQYTDAGAGKYAVFKLDKGNYREVLAAVESASGKPIDREEEK